MLNINSKVSQRLIDGLKRFQPILNSAKTRDVNESDTVVIITDILSEVFGYDKYAEITSEYSIRGTFCDLAIKIDGKDFLLLEVKAIGLDLKDIHIKQAIDYAANKGLEWVVLTNGIIWKVYKVSFTKPIGQELVAEIDLLSLSNKNKSHIEYLYLLSKEGLIKSSLSNYHTQRQATNKFILGNMIVSESFLNNFKKELKKIYPDIKVETSEIKEALLQNVIKREILEGEEAETARKLIGRASKKVLKKFNKKEESLPRAS
jgi:predicted type IV restriction endonuclease